MFPVLCPQLTLIFGTLLDLNCTCSFGKALLFIFPCAAETSLCLPLQQKVMSRGGLGDFGTSGVFLLLQRAVCSPLAVTAPLCAVIPRHPILPYKEGVQVALGRQSCAFWQPLLKLVPSCPRWRGGREKGSEVWGTLGCSVLFPVSPTPVALRQSP